MAWTVLRITSRKRPHAWQPREKNAISVYRDSEVVGTNTVQCKTQPSPGTIFDRTVEAPVILSAAKNPRRLRPQGNANSDLANALAHCESHNSTDARCCDQ